MSYRIRIDPEWEGVERIRVKTDEGKFYVYPEDGEFDDYGFTGNAEFRCYVEDGYEFVQWEYIVADEHSFRKSSDNPLTVRESRIEDYIYITAVTRDATGGDFHYACYDLRKGEYISGYEGEDFSDYEIRRPSISGYDYVGYVYHVSYSAAVEQGEDGYFDGTGTTCDGHDEIYPYVVFFYNSEAPYHYACYDKTNNQYISGYTDIGTDAASITRPNIAGYGYLGYVYHNSFERCISQGSYDSTNITCSSHSSTYPYVVFFYDTTSFTGTMQASGKTTAQISVQLLNGDPDYTRSRYIRLKLNGSWTTIAGQTYYPDQEGGGATSTFNVEKTGLTPNTTYSFEIHLYATYSYGDYYDTGYLISGTFTTNQDASGLMIYVNGWRDAIPYVYYNGAWHRAYSRMYINGWKP